MFITFEGGEGTGKSTQAKLLAEALAAHGHAVVRTREPGGSPGAETLRALLLHGTGWAPTAEMLLHFAARAEHVACTIRPALEAGKIVVCDRYADSTMAYQGYGQGADRASITMLTGLIGLRPDLTLMLEVDRAIALTRLRDRPADRYEREPDAFHARVAEGYRAIAAAEPERCVTVEGVGSPEVVHAAVLSVVLARLPEAG